MKQQQNENSHASAQSRAEGANLTDVLAAEARKAFVAMIKEENFFGPQYSRQSLKAHWTGANGGFADHMLQKRWHDFLAGFKAANVKVRGCALAQSQPEGRT